MYAIVYFNFSGSKDEFKEAKETMEKASNKFNDLDLIDILKPSSEWNYAALVKFKEFKTFLKFTKNIREEPITFFAKRGLEAPPRKLELLVDLDHLE
jgi:hypothetical protein